MALRPNASRGFTQSCEKRLSFVVSVRYHGATRLPPDGFSWNLIFEYLKKNCLENSSFMKIWQELLYMKTDIHFWSSLAQFFLEWEMFRTKVVEKIKTHILCSVKVKGKGRLWVLQHCCLELLAFLVGLRTYQHPCTFKEIPLRRVLVTIVAVGRKSSITYS